MTAFLLILGVPLLGVLLYLSEHVRRNGETPRSRALARISILVWGSVLGLSGVVTLGATVLWMLTGPVPSIAMAVVTFVTRVAAGLLTLWTARCALRVYQLLPASEEVLIDGGRERASEQLRLACVLLILAPLMLMGVFGVLIAVPVLLWGVAFRTTRQARQAQFLWTMALAVRQELPLAEEAELFAQPLWPRQKRVYHSLASRLRDGRSLGEALEMTAGIVPMSLASEVRMAEQTGQLSEVLSQLALSRTDSLDRVRVDSSAAVTLTYGWALLASFLAVVSFLMYWIIPKYKDIFSNFGMPLPAMTVSVIQVSEAFLEHFLIVMPLIALPILAALTFSIVYLVNWSNLNVPLLMRWFPRLDAPALLRTLSHAVGASHPLPDLVEELSHRHLRTDVRQRLARMSDALQQGAPLWDPLCDEGFIRPVEAKALAAAQRANNLPWAMRTLAESMDQSATQRVQFWLEFIKPAVVIGVGLVVGWFVIAMFLPLVELIKNLA